MTKNTKIRATLKTKDAWEFGMLEESPETIEMEVDSEFWKDYINKRLEFELAHINLIAMVKKQIALKKDRYEN